MLVRPHTPKVGAQCQAVHYYRATIAHERSRTHAVFAFAGGASTGIVQLTADQASMAEIADAYVTDVQLGSVEPDRRNGALACMLDPTYHFVCPTTLEMDRFCFSWFHRSRIGVPG